MSLSQFRMKFFLLYFQTNNFNGLSKIEWQVLQARYRAHRSLLCIQDSCHNEQNSIVEDNIIFSIFVIPWYFCEFLSLLFLLQVEDDQPGLRQPGLHQALTRGLSSFPVQNTHGLLTFLDPTITSPSVQHVPPWPVNLVDSSTNRDHVGHSIWATRLPIVRQISAASLRSVFVV